MWKKKLREEDRGMIQTRKMAREGADCPKMRWSSLGKKEPKVEGGWVLGAGARLQEGKEAHGRKAFVSGSQAS